MTDKKTWSRQNLLVKSILMSFVGLVMYGELFGMGLSGPEKYDWFQKFLDIVIFSHPFSLLFQLFYVALSAGLFIYGVCGFIYASWMPPD